MGAIAPAGRDQVRADHGADGAAPHHEPQRAGAPLNRVEVGGRVPAQVQGGVAEADERRGDQEEDQGCRHHGDNRQRAADHGNRESQGRSPLDGPDWP